MVAKSSNLTAFDWTSVSVPLDFAIDIIVSLVLTTTRSKFAANKANFWHKAHIYPLTAM